MNLADILKLAGLTQQEPMSSLSSPGSSCNQHMNPDDMRTLVVKIEQPQLQPEQEMVATEEAEGSYANAPEEKEVGDTHNDFSFKGFGKRKRHTRDALGNYGDNPLEESKMFTEYTNFKEQELNEFWDEAGNWFKGKGYKTDQEISDQKAKANIRKSGQRRGTTSDSGGDSDELKNKGKFVGQSFGGSSGNTWTGKTSDPGEIHTIPGQQQKVRDQQASSKAPATDEIAKFRTATPRTQVVARSKPRQVVKPKLATSTSTLNPNVSPSTSVSQPAQVASPKPPVIQRGHEGEAAGRKAGLEAEKQRKQSSLKKHGGYDITLRPGADGYKSPLRRRQETNSS